jgi:hypothetical protein
MLQSVGQRLPGRCSEIDAGFRNGQPRPQRPGLKSADAATPEPTVDREIAAVICIQ